MSDVQGQMSYEILDCAQGTAEWFAARLGRVTGSGAANVLPLRDLGNPTGRDNAGMREDYCMRLACERISGEAGDSSFKSAAMERGTELEPFARARYCEEHPNYDVREIGFIKHTATMTGDSPDGLIYDASGIIGGLEIKCPGPLVHWKYLKAGVVPQDYLRQMLHHLWSIPEACWWDFASYHPSLPGRAGWFEVRMERTAVQNLLDIYDKAVREFLGQVDALEYDIRALA